MDVHDHVVAFGEAAFDLTVAVRKFLLQKAAEALEAFRAVLGVRIVLGATRSEIFAAWSKSFLLRAAP